MKTYKQELSNIETINILGKSNIVKSEDTISQTHNYNKLNKFKSMFGFSSQIEDDRAIDVLSDSGFGGMTVYITLYDFSDDRVRSVNGFTCYKENNYCLKLNSENVSWLDLWKSIEEIVKFNGYKGEFVINNFVVKESCNNKFYLKPNIILVEGDY